MNYRFFPIALLLTALWVSANAFAADNELTEAEKKDGWLLLFNGKNHDGWINNNGKPIISAIEDGCLQTYKCGGYILTYDKAFGDFVFKCDVKMDEVCNSGIFLRIENLKNPVNTGFEIQVHTSAKDAKPTVNSHGSLYDVKAASENPNKGPGEWESLEITFIGPKLSVKQNGKEILTANLDDYDEPGKRDVPGNHKFVLDGKPRAIKDFARTGYLGFQDHNHKCWYKNVKLLPLDNKEVREKYEKKTGSAGK